MANKEYIDREALISKIVNTPFVVNCTGETEDYKDGMLDGLVKKQNNVIDMIQKQPVANVVEIKRGKWIIEPPYKTSTGYYKACICPFCHSFFVSDGNEPWKLHPYCCECGAKLE